MPKLKKVLYTFVACATILWSAGILGMPARVYAASTIAVTNGTYNANFSGFPMPASSSAVAIAKVTVTASQSSQTLTSVTANFSGTGFATSDLASIATGDSSGVALYTDHTSSGTAGTFDSGTDPVVTLAASPAWTPSTTNITLTPATSVSLTSGVGKVFYIVIKTSSTITNEDVIDVTIPVNGVVTSDGSGPTTAFDANYFEADTEAVQISSIEGFSGSATLTVRFSKPVQKLGGGNLSYVGAGDPFTFTDGGGTTQAISSITHTAGQSFATITLNNANLSAEDVDGSPATLAAGSNKITDMGGNVVGTTAVSLSSALAFDTAVLPTVTVGTAYSTTVTAKGGASSYSYTTNAAADAGILTTVGLSLSSGGTLSGTPNNVPGSYQLTLKVTDGAMATATRTYTLNVASSGGAVPGITSISPTGGAQSASALAVTVTGSNTSFTSTSTVEFLLNGTADTNITVSGRSAASTTSLSFNLAIAAGATAGNRDVRITTGTQVVSLPNSFTIFAGGGTGLTLLLPTDAATNVQMPPGFSFSPSTNSSLASYRITMKSTSDFSGSALWDYVFPTGSTGHCSASACNLPFGTGTFRVVTQPAVIAANTTYYWQVRTYSQAVASVSDDVTSLESSLIRSFTTVSTVSDVSLPQIIHRPVSQIATGAARVIVARVTDNIATNSTTPALTTSLVYCNSSTSCSPSTTVTGVYVAGGYWKYTILQTVVDHANSAANGIRYYLTASDGTNTSNFKQTDGTTPFSISIASLTTTHKLVGAVTDQASACLPAVYVFAQGTSFNTLSGDGTACPGGTFSLSSIPPGSYDLTAFKEGYGDRQMQGAFAIPTADSSPSYAFSLTSGAGGGFGGDSVSPRVINNGPMDGTKNLPGNDTNFRIFIVFNEAMSQSTMTASNLFVKDVNIATGTTTDITTGTWTYYASAPGAGTFLPTQTNMVAWAPASVLGDGKTISVVVSSNVTDTAGNAIQSNQPDGSYSFSFSTGTSANFTGFNTTTGGFTDGGTFGSGQYVAPRVTGMTPPPGTLSVARNAKIILNFSEAMADDAGSYLLKDFVKLYTVSGATETDVSSTAIDTVVLDSGKRSATVSLKSTYNSGAFAASTSYRVKVLGGGKAATSITLAPPSQSASVMYTSDFKTGTSSDTDVPTIIGSFPDSGATAVPVNLGSVSVAFSKDMNSSTITTSTFYLSVGSTVINGTVEYKPNDDQVIFIPSSALSPSTTYTLNMTTGIQGLNGVAIAAATRTFTTGSADTSAPSVSYVNADDYNLAITFSEPMNAAKVTDTANYAASVVKPANFALTYGVSGFVTGTSIAIPATASFGFDAPTSTLTISGYHGSGVTAATLLGKEILVTVSNVKDLSGNIISGTTGRAPVANSSTTKGALGPGTEAADTSASAGFMSKNFSSTTFGFAPQVEVRPFNAMAGRTTIYGARIPISVQIPASGTIVLTFPAGFNVAGAKQDVQSPMRTDLNGPGTGSPTFKCTTATGGTSCGGAATVTGDTSADGDSTTRGGLADDGVVVNATARTVTVSLSAATNTTNDFLMIDIDGIVNSTVPKDFNTAGYTVDIKTKNGTTLLESLVSGPFFIQGINGTSYTLSGTITATGATTGTMKVYLMSPMTGSMDATSGTFAAGSATYSFTGIQAGDYWLSTDPSITLGATDYSGKSMPERVVISETQDTANSGANDDTIPYNFTITNASTGGTDVTISIDGPSSELLDIFASSSTGFKSKQVTLDTSAGAQDFTINLADGTWYVGVGPQMPKGFSGPPKAPNYLPPKPKETRVTNPTCTVEGAAGCSMTFTLTATTKTIQGTVKDAASKVIANAEVYAYSPNGGFGTHGQTDTSGAFSLGVADGSYVVGAFVPGMPSSKEVPVVVTSNATTYLLIDGATTAVAPATAATTFILKIAKPDYTITGKVTDGTSVVQGASVYAYRTDGPGHANAMTNSSGNYTLYVSNGTWNVGSFLPQYGNLTEISVTISSANSSGNDFAPSSTGTFQTISGTVTSNGAAAQGAFVKISRSGFFNETITGSDGTYSMKVPVANGYVIRAFVPGVGESAPLAAFNVESGSDYTGKNITIGTLRTVTFTFSSTVTEAYAELSSSTGLGGRVKIENATTGTLQVPDGTYKVNVDVPGAAIGLTAVAATTGATSYSSTTGVVTVADGNEGLTITVPTLRTITGTVVDGSAVAIASAWVELVNTTDGISHGITAGSDGTFSIKVSDGSYQINATMPGYFRNASSLTVNASTAAQTLSMSSASTTISGQVLIGSSGAANAFVRAEKQGGGFSGTKADASGNYTLKVTSGIWKVYAVADGYAETAYTLNPIDVTGGSVEDKDITVSTSVTLSAPKSKPVTPDSGGTLEDDTAGVKLTIPAKALGSSKSAGSVEAKETNNVRETASAKPIKSCESAVCSAVGKEIKIIDSDDNAVNDLDLPITIELTYTLAELAASASSSDSSIDTLAEADALKMSYWDETSQNWVAKPSTITYKESDGDVITDATTIDTAAEFAASVATITIAAETLHLSLYALTEATNPLSPTTAATGLAATAVGGSRVNLTWTQDDEATAGYDIYRSTTSGGLYALVGGEPTVSSGATVTYSDTTVASATTYYYKISSLNSNGESVASAAVNVTTGSGGGGGGVTVVPPSVTVSAPNGGESWAKGSSQYIRWGSSGSVSFVNLAYSIDNGATWVSIVTNQLNTGSYAWTVPSIDTSKALIRVQATDLAVVTTTDQTDAVFTIGSATVTQTPASDSQAHNKLVSGAPALPTGVVVHNLVKLPDDGDPKTQYDSAVYYVATDGKRHAFTNSRLYFTWYCDFSAVKVISAETMAKMPLGKNVTYQPGKRMVKFHTDNRVYAVDLDGNLRWVQTETLAKGLYGSDWNKKIDDIEDVFYRNYTFGDDVKAVADFEPATAEKKVTNPSDSMAIKGHTRAPARSAVGTCPVK